MDTTNGVIKKVAVFSFAKQCRCKPCCRKKASNFQVCRVLWRRRFHADDFLRIGSNFQWSFHDSITGQISPVCCDERISELLGCLVGWLPDFAEHNEGMYWLIG